MDLTTATAAGRSRSSRTKVGNMLSMNRETKPGHWQTVAPKEKKQKRQEEKKDVKKDRLGVAIDPTAAAFAAFDRSYANKAAAAKAAAAAAAQQKDASYSGAFAGLVDEVPQVVQDEEGSSGDEGSSAAAPAAAAKAPKQPKAPKKPKLTVAQVAAGVDVAALKAWMTEVKRKYSKNETAQLEALSDWLLVAFKEASLDLGKLLSTKGLAVATEQPLAEVPQPLLSTITSFVSDVGDDALLAMCVPLTAAVVSEAVGGPSGTAPTGKGKAGLQVMLAVILRTRPQVLVRAAPELRLAGRQLSGAGRLQVLLWVVNQAAVVDPSVGVAVWVRLLLPQLLGLPELPASSSGAPSSSAAAAKGSGSKGITPAALVDDLMRPLEVPLQGPAVQFLAGLLSKLQASGAAAATGDVRHAGGDVEPTVPGAAVELLSRLAAGKPVTTAAAPTAGGPGAAAAAAAAAVEGKKAAAARAAAASALAPQLPGLTQLAAATSCLRQYSDWLLLALESAAQSDAAPESPDQLVQRSASSVVACICGSDACFALWESKHKGSLRGSARVLAALLQRPELLKPLLQQPDAAGAFRELLAALPARHRAHLAAGKGWQGSCARVAEDACSKLPKKLGRAGRGGKGAARSQGSGSSSLGSLGVVLGATAALAGVVVMAGLYRREVAGVVQAYAGKEAAQQVDTVLLPLEASLQQLQAAAAPHVAALQAAAAPHIESLQAAAGPHLEAARAAAAPLLQQVQDKVAPVMAPVVRELEQVMASASKHLQEMLEKAKSQ
ncbi:hypothetical protein OEZ86_003823 [Tetradesmus obliquus]|nr:hypothetical protein OEZ86_003823 [Tetradesmus obliquus]